MAIPLATTTIAVLRVEEDETRDPYDAAPDPDTVASGVRAHISSPGGSENVAGGSQEVVTFRLDCDPTDITNTDQVQDETTDALYEVVWVEQRQGLGLDHTVADLKRVTGVV